jgi:hypothetical protein
MKNFTVRCLEYFVAKAQMEAAMEYGDAAGLLDHPVFKEMNKGVVNA